MRFYIGALVALSLVSSSVYASSYNPYSFFFHFEQDATVPLRTYYIYESRYSNSNKCRWFYGTDLDYFMEMWTYYPPLYIQKTQDSKRDYVWHIHITLYKEKNEDVYHFAYSVGTLGSWTSIGSPDVIIPKDVVAQIFNDTQLPIKQFSENADRYKSYSFGTHSLKELSEGEMFSAFKTLITFVNLELKDKGVEIKLDPNDFKATMDFRKKWLSLATWGRWAD